VKRLTFFLGLSSIAAAALVAFAALTLGGNSTQAAGPNGLSVDWNIADNTDIAVGTIVPCGEVVSGGSYTVDVVLEGVSDIVAVQMTLGYPAGALNTHDISSSLLNNEDPDQGGSALVDVTASDPHPAGGDLDGSHKELISNDIGIGVGGATGSGILVRFTLTAPVGIGVFPLALSGVELNDSQAGTPTAHVHDGKVAVGTTCPAPTTVTPSPSASPTPGPTPSGPGCGPGPEDDGTALVCTFSNTVDDGSGGADDDCDIHLPCSITTDLAIEKFGGTGEAEAGDPLAPAVTIFSSGSIDFANDLDVANGSAAGSIVVSIRADVIEPFNANECFAQLTLGPETLFESAIKGNAPAVNSSSGLGSPDFWPNDLNGEKVVVEAAFGDPDGPGPGVGALTLWSRAMTVFAGPAGPIPLNVLYWHTAGDVTGFDSRWVTVSFTGDPVPDNPFTPAAEAAAAADAGTVATPDADDPPASGTVFCTPFTSTATSNGTAGGVPYRDCTSTGTKVFIANIDPTALGPSGDEGTRPDVSSCSDTGDAKVTHRSRGPGIRVSAGGGTADRPVVLKTTNVTAHDDTIRTVLEVSGLHPDCTVDADGPGGNAPINSGILVDDTSAYAAGQVKDFGFTLHVDCGTGTAYIGDTFSMIATVDHAADDYPAADDDDANPADNVVTRTKITK